ncbi:H-2 class II histocompatibility antigen, I-E beta chain-like [Corvus cornix cornix]|uniref:H-2 class II histocompatibility antigen, I-E beta chain-like n=1 Tax=Corvus cornix cornix TaxID=932674 RepID=UPI001950C314|nr:H-2 class II histocompatibility antigen, I-E beta chain-like [Corvus cornix cornix]
MGPQNALSQSERAALLTPHWSRLELPVQRGCFGAGGTCPALAMGRVAAAGAVLVALVVLGAPPATGTELSGVFQGMMKSECHFIKGTERVRLVQMHSYNREQYTHFDSDVGVCIRDTPDGEKQAWYWNSQLENPEYRWALVDMHCHYNYEIVARFLVSRRAPLGGTAGPAAWEPRECPSGIHGTHCNELEFQFPVRKRCSCPSRQSSEGAETQVEQDLTVTFHCQPPSPHLWLS